ncbi:MAG: MFS transporter [Chloroflexales bacterium]|nr:MFS transporter [Chloroflexales bacterium]
MPRLNREATLALVCAVYLAAGLALASVGPSLVALAANVGQGVAVIGSQFTAFSLGTVVVQLAAPPLSARYGQRAVLALGLLLMGGGVLGESLSRALAPLLLLALLGGLGFGCILAAGSVLVPRLYPARGTSTLNLVNLFFGVGSIIGPLVAGWSAARYGAPQAALWLGASLLLLLLPGALFAAEAPSGAGGGAGRGGAVPWGLVLLLGLLLLVYSGTEIAIGGWAAVYLQASLGMAPGQAAVVVAGFWLALTVGRAGGVLLGLRLGGWRLLLGALALMFVGTGLLALGVGDGARSVAALLLIGLACGPVFPTTMALVASVSGGRSGATGLALAVGNFGGASIPPLMGVLVQGPGPGAGAGLTLALAALLLGLLGAAAWAGRAQGLPAEAPRAL